MADRANARLQYFTLDGQHLSFVEGLSYPANIDQQGDLLLVPDLHANVVLMDKENKLIHLGKDPKWTEEVLGGGKFPVRGNPASWQDGKWVHLHDACFDKDGNIFVVEWVPTGRVTKLVKVSQPPPAPDDVVTHPRAVPPSNGGAALRKLDDGASFASYS